MSNPLEFKVRRADGTIVNYIDQDSSCTLEFKIRGENGLEIPNTDITKATIEKFDKISETRIPINGDNVADFISSINAQGDVNFHMASSSNPIHSTKAVTEEEIHVLMIRVTATVGPRTEQINKEGWMRIRRVKFLSLSQAP